MKEQAAVFWDSFEALCRKANVTCRYAMACAVPDSGEDGISALMDKLRNRVLPPEDVAVAIANYFGVAMADMGLDPPVLTYLAGPVTGRPDFMERFAAGQAFLESHGHHVINPAAITSVMPKAHMTRRQFMQMGIAELMCAGRIAMLPGWEANSGCRMEHAVAAANLMPVQYLTEEDVTEGLLALAEDRKDVTE